MSWSCLRTDSLTVLGRVEAPARTAPVSAGALRRALGSRGSQRNCSRAPARQLPVWQGREIQCSCWHLGLEKLRFLMLDHPLVPVVFPYLQGIRGLSQSWLHFQLPKRIYNWHLDPTCNNSHSVVVGEANDGAFQWHPENWHWALNGNSWELSSEQKTQYLCPLLLTSAYT